MHDETTCHAWDTIRSGWSRIGSQFMFQKSKGQGVMISDHIFEEDGFIELTDHEYKRFCNEWKPDGREWKDVRIDDATKQTYDQHTPYLSKADLPPEGVTLYDFNKQKEAASATRRSAVTVEDEASSHMYPAEYSDLAATPN